MAVDVPFSRNITLGTIGNDVVGYKIGISRFAPDLYPWPKKGFTPYAGDIFVGGKDSAVFKVQARLGIKPKTGIIGPKTHVALEKAVCKRRPKEPAFNIRAQFLLEDFYERTHISPEERMRRDMLEAMQYWYGHKWSIQYSQHRPFTVCRVPTVPSRWDCSAFATNVHTSVGAPNPNKRLNDGQGYTGTLMNAGERCNYSDLEIGDLIFYGYTTRSSPAFPIGSPTHVAPFAGGGRVYSLGSFPMGFYDYDYRGINHFRHYEVIR